MIDLETKARLEKVKDRIADSENPVELVNNMYGSHPETLTRLDVVKNRMANWQDPVEIVNNIYGSHPGDDGREDDGLHKIGYFERIFSFN